MTSTFVNCSQLKRVWIIIIIIQLSILGSKLVLTRAIKTAQLSNDKDHVAEFIHKAQLMNSVQLDSK